MGKVVREYLNDYLLDKETTRAKFGMMDIKVDLNRIRRKTEKGMDDHKESGRQEGISSLVCILKTLLPDAEAVYHKIRLDDNYKDVIREQVEEIIQGLSEKAYN